MVQKELTEPAEVRPGQERQGPGQERLGLQGSQGQVPAAMLQEPLGLPQG